MSSPFVNGGTVTAANGTLVFGSMLVNSGTVQSSATGALTIQGGGTVQNAGGTIVADGSGVQINSMTVDSGSLMAQNGGALTLNNDAVTGDTTVKSTGAVNVTGGVLLGVLTVDNGGTANLTGATLGTTINGGSMTTLSGSTVTAASSFTNSTGGQFTVGGGSVFIVNQSGTLTNDGTISVSGVFVAGSAVTLSGTGTMTLNGGSLVGGGTLINGAGHTINGAGPISGLAFENDGILAATTGPITYTGPSFTNNGTIQADLSVVGLSGPFTNFSGGVLTGGTYDVAQGFYFSGADITTNDARIILPNSGAIHDSNTNQNGLRNFLTNDGTFDLEDAVFTSNASGDFVNNGSVVLGGTSQFFVGGGHDFVMNAGATLSGTGIIHGPVENLGGVVAPGSSPGTLTILGDYLQSSTGELDIQFATPGSFEFLFINGGADLAGTLRILVDPGFNAPLFSVFTILLAPGGIHGGFDNFISPYFASRMFIEVPVQGGIGLQVVNSPEPALFPVMLAALAMLLLGARRLRCQ